MACTGYTTNYLVEYPLGFDSLPSAPVVWGVETDFTQPDAKGDVASIFFHLAGTALEDFKDKGMGIPIATKENKYRYKVSFINTAGAESPLSAVSNTVEWTTPNPAIRYGLVVEIPLGNNDVIARRIYRTKNFSDDSSFDGDTFYFVAEIPNNRDDFFIDDLPDSAVGSQAPSLLDSVPFPAMKCRYLGS